MSFRPSDTLRSRTFVGLLVAQFLAAFNDQAIHASAMFFALHKGVLTEAQAVNLMPILFYSPWAIFVTLAAWLADRYSKRQSLVAWKFAEVGITAVAALGFWIGGAGHPLFGVWIVLGCVFLMGMHSAFFVPAKYGVMPEILAPQLLSKGNGILEMLSFLAIILGTVSGGLLSHYLQKREVYIGLIFVALAVVGAASSLSIEKMPAANPTRKFPRYLYGPLWHSLRVLFAARPLRLAVVGIAFFTFVVAFMRATVYMLGLSQNPPWNEFETSVIVGMSALGIGLGSPLAGWLSGRKIELGLVPWGGLGMVLGVAIAAGVLTVLHGYAMVAGLVACIVLIGFCTSFYLVPMYTLLQHRAPKTAKGDAVATSNFFNVAGAILASLVSIAVVWSAKHVGITPEVAGKRDVLSGRLLHLTTDKFGRPVFAKFEEEPGVFREFGRPPQDEPEDELPWDLPAGKTVVIKASPWVESHERERPEVTVSRYDLRGVTHIGIRERGVPARTAYDYEPLPRYLFLGAGLITGATLLLLVAILPDLPQRAWWVAKNLRGPKVAAMNTHNIPATGPVAILCGTWKADWQGALRSATDRYIHFASAGGEARANAWLEQGEAVAFVGEEIELVPREYRGAVTTCTIQADAKGDLVVDFFDQYAGPIANRQPDQAYQAR